MFDTNGEMIHHALVFWENHIRYGTAVPKYGAKPKELNEDQMRHVLRLRVLQKKVLENKSIDVNEAPTLE